MPAAGKGGSLVRFRTLDDWLRWQETLHPQSIALGLERVHAVAGRMGWPACGCSVLTVGGTNGKGSTVAFLEAILEEAGYRTGAYTSPHLLRYNERVRLRRQPVGDDALCEAFARSAQSDSSTNSTAELDLRAPDNKSRPAIVMTLRTSGSSRTFADTAFPTSSVRLRLAASGRLIVVMK